MPTCTGAASGGTRRHHGHAQRQPVTASRTFAALHRRQRRQPSVLRRLRQRHDDRQHRDGNGNYTFGGLTVVTGTPHCDVSTGVGGWALIVIYEGASERLRAINLFDGLDYFCGSQLTLTPDGFRVPPTNIDGRIAVFTLDGDPANSDQLNGIDEALRYNGTLLDDGIKSAGSVPTVQQFDGTINTRASRPATASTSTSTTSARCSRPAQTSGTTLYSAGADLVLLMAQIVSATSDPAVDLGVTMSHTGNFVSGGTGQYTITVSNAARHGARRQHRHGDRHAARGPHLQRVDRHGLELQRRGAGGDLHACADAQCRRLVPGR